MKVSFKALRIIQIVSVILFIVFVLWVSNAAAALVGFSGTTPTEREPVDGVSQPLGLSEIAGFNIHCGATQGDYQDTVFIAGATLPDTAWELDRPIGTHYCVVTTLDIDGRESVYSDEVMVIVEGKSRPKPPMIAPNQIIRVVTTLP